MVRAALCERAAGLPGTDTLRSWSREELLESSTVPDSYTLLHGYGTVGSLYEASGTNDKHKGPEFTIDC